MQRIYIYEWNGLVRMADGESSAAFAIKDGAIVYALDVEEYVPATPRAERWVVVDKEGDAVARRGFIDALPESDRAVSYDRESDAIILKNVLTRGGMTDLTVRKIDGE